MVEPTRVGHSWVEPAADTERLPPRRLPGLRMPVLPSGPLLAQVGGGVATLAGLYLLAGLSITLIAGGVVATVLGALREAKKI